MSHISDILCSIRNMKIISLSGAMYLMRKALRLTGLITWSIDGRICTYLDLGPPVPLGGSAKEKSSSVYGDPAGSMPADTMTNFFFESASPCLLQPPLFLLPSSGTQYIAVICSGLSLCCQRMWSAIFLLHPVLVVTMSWSRSMPVITSSFVAWSCHDYALVRFYHIIHAKVIHSLGPALVVGERGA